MRCAETLFKLPDDVQRSVLAGDSSGSALKKKINTASREWKKVQPVVLPQGRYAVIVADPPWPVDKTPYPTMKISEIDADLRQLLEAKAAEHCHLFVWTTMAHLPDALLIIQQLGWTYKFLLTWHKTNGPQNPLGPMYNSEFVVGATKGSPIFIDTRDFKTCFDGKKQGHSKKPDEFYKMIKRATLEPRLELYTRDRHDGFEAHGNEVSAFEPIVFEPPRPMKFDDGCTRAKSSGANRSLTSPAIKLETIWLMHLKNSRRSAVTR